ncbi:hypothetical protein ACWNT8_01220 [Pigmentibacter ruber]
MKTAYLILIMFFIASCGKKKNEDIISQKFDKVMYVNFNQKNASNIENSVSYNLYCGEKEFKNILMRDNKILYADNCTFIFNKINVGGIEFNIEDKGTKIDPEINNTNSIEYGIEKNDKNKYKLIIEIKKGNEKNYINIELLEFKMNYNSYKIEIGKTKGKLNNIISINLESDQNFKLLMEYLREGQVAPDEKLTNVTNVGLYCKKYQNKVSDLLYVINIWIDDTYKNVCDNEKTEELHSIVKGNKNWPRPYGYNPITTNKDEPYFYNDNVKDKKFSIYFFDDKSQLDKVTRIIQIPFTQNYNEINRNSNLSDPKFAIQYFKFSLTSHKYLYAVLENDAQIGEIMCNKNSLIMIDNNGVVKCLY